MQKTTQVEQSTKSVYQQAIALHLSGAYNAQAIVDQLLIQNPQAFLEMHSQCFSQTTLKPLPDVKSDHLEDLTFTRYSFCKNVRKAQEHITDRLYNLPVSAVVDVRRLPQEGQAQFFGLNVQDYVFVQDSLLYTRLDSTQAPKTVEAVRHVRSVKGLGVKEAKAIVDKIKVILCRTCDEVRRHNQDLDESW